ncbi:MAG: glycosyltransferase, partial [Kiloniellaceae bacterium]
MLIAAAALSLGIWLYLILGHGGFWRVRMLPEAPPAGAAPWPEVLAIVPARDEAAVIARAVTALLGQDYPARLHVVVVDDHSQDGTAEAALAAARAAGGAGRLDVVAARPRPAGWAGKVWALAEGLARGGTMAPTAPYVWLSDADIVHAPGTLG